MRISIIVPTYNEETTIAELMENLASLGAWEIVVADGGSEDRTRDLAAARGRVLLVPAGRAIQMNAGAKASSGDVLLFLHADVRLEPSALTAVVKAMEDQALVGGNFDIRYDGRDLAAWAFTTINRGRRRWGIFYGDSGIFCRRDVFERLGGYREWPIMEDYEFARRLWKDGKVALLDEPIWVSARRWRNSGLLPTLWSWFLIQALYLAGVAPAKLSRLYRRIR
ncbi:MAG: TIGR04283 family arsenosugar biosynthesis glycosyltransferase [Acidobacteriota bacterium]|nr:TIGR04283 family arsenosugar biosynthesis glycosyltransferase [Acidobacteriota bacterium]